MYKSVKDHDARWWNVRNLDTGLDIDGVIEADDATGIYRRYVTDENKPGFLVRGDDGNPIIVEEQGHIKIYDSRIGFP